MKEINSIDLGKSPYRETWDLQAAIQKRLIDEKLAVRKGVFEGERSHDVLMFVEHPHVYTLGKSGDPAHLLKDEQELAGMNATYVKTNRGGDITYHGPGQIVGYPIIDLDRYFTDIHKYMRSLEEVIIRVCSDYGIDAGRIQGLTGTWVGHSKICAMGVKCSRWVTMHGFALNVKTNLKYFNNIIPCGIADKGVTSLELLLGREIAMDDVKQRIQKHFGAVFGAKVIPVDSLPEFEREFAYFKDK